MPAGVLPEAGRRTIPLTDQGAKGGRELGVPVGGPIVAPRRQIFLPDEWQIRKKEMADKEKSSEKAADKEKSSEKADE